jgi:hypothetical protein
MDPSISRGGVPWDDDPSNPGGLEADELEEAMKFIARHAASLAEAAENGVSEMRVGKTAPSRASRRTGGQLPFDDGEDGHTTMGRSEGPMSIAECARPWNGACLNAAR